MEPVQRIAVVRALQVGDLLCAVPAFRSLRATEPGAHITLIGLPWAQDFVRRYSDLFDAFEEFPGFPGVPEAIFEPRRTHDFFARCLARPYDLVVQMHGAGTDINDFVALMGPSDIAGFCPPNDAPQGPGFLPYPSHGHETARLLSLASHLGWSIASSEHDFPTDAADRRAFEELRSSLGLDTSPFAVIHVGARDPLRRWSPEGFAAVADALGARGISAVLTGVAEEESQVLGVSRLMRHDPMLATGKTTLGSLASMLAKARVLVSNDTGVAHLGRAVGVPRVVVTTGSDPERWSQPGPFERVFVEASAPENQCRHEGPQHRCYGDACRLFSEGRQTGPVPVEDVVKAALELSELRGSHAA